MTQSEPQGNKSRHALTFAAIVILALGLRLVHLHQSSRVPGFNSPISDGKSYFEWSRQIAMGDWIGHEVFYQAPLYPYFLGVTQWVVGQDLGHIRIVQAILGSLACGLLYLSGRHLFSEGVGLIAGILMAVYPPAIFFDLLIQKAVLDILLMCLLLFLLSMLNSCVRGAHALLAGIVVGCFALTRENVLLFVPVILAWLVIHRPSKTVTPAIRRVGAALLFLSGTAIPLTPVGFRNKHIGGTFLVTTSQLGPNLYIGNNGNANGTYGPLSPGRADPQFEHADATDLAQRARGRVLTPAEVSDYWASKGLEFIRSEPLAWLRLMGRKCMMLFNAYEIPDSEDLYFYMDSCSLINVLGKFWHFGILMPLAIVGISLTWPRIRDLWILHALLLALSLGIVVFYNFARYRYPLTPILALFAAAGLTDAVGTLRRGEIRRVITACIPAMILAIHINWPAAKSSDAVSHANAGAALVDQGEYASGIIELQKALELNPTLSAAQVSLANAYLRQGNLDLAINAFQHAIELRPDDPEIAVDLGTILVKAGRFDEAKHYLTIGLAAAQRRPKVYTSLGILFARMQRWSESIEILRMGAREAPNELTILANLAWNLATCPEASLRNGAEAIQFAEICCKASNYAEPGALDILAAAQAEMNRFDDAIATEQKALSLALQERGYPIKDFQERLNLYKTSKPFRRH